MVKILLVIVPKAGNAAGAKIKAEALMKGVTDKSISYDKLKADSGKDYQGGDLLISQTAQHAQQLGISYDDLRELFSYKVGYISSLEDNETDYRFYVVRQKYAAQMLSISDFTKTLRTPSNFEYKQKDDKLKALLDWDK